MTDQATGIVGHDNFVDTDLFAAFALPTRLA
jgi:hypothetical protein